MIKSNHTGKPAIPYTCIREKKRQKGNKLPKK